MSLITSCPACGTMFRVVPDQLKISEGWVRCGHCSEVFDAAAHLSDESVLGALPEAQATQSAELREELPPAPPPPPASSPRTGPQRAAGAPEAGERSEEPSDFFDVEPTDEPLVPSPLDAPFVFRRSELTAEELERADRSGESQMLPDELMPPSRTDEEEVRNVSFVRQGRRRAYWRRPFVRLVLSVFVLALGAALALQVAYLDRDRLAVAQPALRPVLEQMCDFLQCRLGPPRQIEAIMIDSSGFNRLRGDTYRLSFTLRNTGPVQVAAPAMELTITDSQDQTLVRRVLTPAELGADNHVIPAAGEWSRTVGVVLDTGGSPRVAGYRLLAFYP